MPAQANQQDLVSIDTNTLADVTGGWGAWGAYRAATLAAIATGTPLPYYYAPVVPVPMFRRYWRR